MLAGRSGRWLEAFAAASELACSQLGSSAILPVAAVTSASLEAAAAAAAGGGSDGGRVVSAAVDGEARLLRQAVAELSTSMLADYVRLHIAHASSAHAIATPAVEAPVADGQPHQTSGPDGGVVETGVPVDTVDFGALASVCHELCISTCRPSSLFGPIYDLFLPHTTARRAFVLGLEPYLLARRLPMLPPPILLELAILLTSAPAESPPGTALAAAPPPAATRCTAAACARLEACLLALQPGEGPNELLLAVSRRLRLLSTHTRASNLAADFHSPLDVMLTTLIAPPPREGGDACEAAAGRHVPAAAQGGWTAGVVAYADAAGMARLQTAHGALAAAEAYLPLPPRLESADVRACGYKLLLYLRHCLEGLAFPTGEPLPPERAAAARAQTCAYLFDPEHSSRRLAPLLDFDAVAALGVLARAFDELPLVVAVEAEPPLPPGADEGHAVSSGADVRTLGNTVASSTDSGGEGGEGESGAGGLGSASHRGEEIAPGAEQRLVVSSEPSGGGGAPSHAVTSPPAERLPAAAKGLGMPSAERMLKALDGAVMGSQLESGAPVVEQGALRGARTLAMDQFARMVIELQLVWAAAMAQIRTAMPRGRSSDARGAEASTRGEARGAAAADSVGTDEAGVIGGDRTADAVARRVSKESGGEGATAVPTDVLTRSTLALARHIAVRHAAALQLAARSAVASQPNVSMAVSSAPNSDADGGEGGDDDEMDGDDLLISRLVKEDTALPRTLVEALQNVCSHGAMPRTCAALHVRGGRLAQALQTCLDNGAPHGFRAEAVRLAVESIVAVTASEAYSVPAITAKRALRELILERVGELDAIDHAGCVGLLRHAFDGEGDRLLAHLKGTPRLQLDYMRSLMPAASLADGTATEASAAATVAGAMGVVKAAAGGGSMPIVSMEHLPVRWASALSGRVRHGAPAGRPLSCFPNACLESEAHTPHELLY